MRPIAAIASALLLACSARSAPEPAPVRLGVSALRISLPVFLALEQGLFAAHGLEIELTRFDTAQPLADELAAERLDAAGYVALPILFAQGSRPALHVSGAIVEDERHPISYLLGRKGAGLRGVASLRGKRVGVLPTIAYRRWLEAILAADGLRPDELAIVPIAPPLEVDALSDGGVDALFTGDPMATAALARGVAEPITDTPDVPRVLGAPFLFGTFALSARFTAARPAEARALVLALDEAIDRLRADPALGRRAMTGFLRESERGFAERYPDARYLRSDELEAPALDRALELAEARVRAAEVLAR